MRIQHNIAAMNSYRNYTNNVSALNKNLEKLSSGYKINRAGDDAAGLAISEKMRAQITGLGKAQDNAKDGISLVQTAEGALTEVHDMLNRMYELAEQSANGTYDGTDRTQLQKEVNNLRTEIDRIADSANFNGIQLLDGSRSEVTTFGSTQFDVAVDSVKLTDGTLASITVSVSTVASTATAAGTASINLTATGATVTINLATGVGYSATDIQNMLTKMTATASSEDQRNILAAAKGATVVGQGVKATDTTIANLTNNGKAKGEALTLQIGDTSDDFNKLAVSIRATDSEALAIDELDISTQAGAADALDVIKAAINYVSDVRGTLGATQNRLDHTINNLSVMEENIQDAESTIRDTDVAEEMMAYTKNNILIQSAQAMLAQANQVSQGVLQLLQEAPLAFAPGGEAFPTMRRGRPNGRPFSLFDRAPRPCSGQIAPKRKSSARCT